MTFDPVLIGHITAGLLAYRVVLIATDTGADLYTDRVQGEADE